MHRFFRTISTLVFLLVFTGFAYSQDLENLSDISIVKASGGVSFTTMLTETTDLKNQRDPFFWQFQGNLNLNFFGIIDAPFSMSLNNQEASATQPALPTQFGISPNYKQYTAHFGYRSMNFSRYTLGALTFFGAGAEVKPKNYWLQGGAMYGRLTKSIQPIKGQDQGIYKRIGYGFNITAGDRNNNVKLVFFRAKDDVNSILLDSLHEDVAPRENLTYSIISKNRIGKNWTIKIEYAVSALTQDIRNEERTLNEFTYYNNIGNLFTPNATTQVKKAIEVLTDYKLRALNIQFGYKRIDPDFETLGTSSINNDLQEFKVGLAWPMFKNKLTIATKGGVQKNNLDESQEQGIKKLIGSANVSWMATEQLNFNASISTFSSQTLRRAAPINQPVNIQTDTLEFFQVTKNMSFTTNYQFGNDQKRQGIMLSTNYQNATDSENNDNNALNTNLAYTFSLTGNKLNISASYNFNRTVASGLIFISNGPTIAISKPIIKDKVKLSGAYTFLNSSQDGTVQNAISNINLAAKYTFKKTHNFSVGYLVSSRTNKIDSSASAQESRLNFKYGFSF